MPEPVSTDAPKIHSPARQLLAALARASQDMEKSIKECYEYLSGLNADLEQVVNAQLNDADEHVKGLLHAQLRCLSSKKDLLFSELAELRQQELKVLQTAGANLRQALLEKLEKITGSFHSELELEFESFRLKLEAASKEISENAEISRNTLHGEMPDYLSTVREAVARQKQDLEKQQAEYQATLTQQSQVSLHELFDHYSDLKARLESFGESCLQEMNQNAEKLRSGQVDNMSRHVKSLSLMEETAGRRIDLLAGAYLSVLEELPGNFEKSCHEMAEIQVGLHNTLAKYRALQYQTEIRSAAQAAEEHLQIVRADLQSMLSRYENDYARRIDVLFSRFEKSAADIAGLHVSSPSPHIDRDRVIEKIREKFGDLRKAVIESAKEQVGATEATLDKACEESCLRLEKARENCCSKIENSFRDSQQEFLRLQHSSEEHQNELSQEISGLEQSINEARELIRALDQASQDF